MTAATLVEPTFESVETRLRDELARGDAMVSTAAPILRQLLAGDHSAMLSDEVVARVRGMLAHVARQLLHAQAEAAGIVDPRPFVAEREDELAGRLADEPGLLAHTHAVAIEGRMALELQARCNIDPVLCPLLQASVASRDDGVAGEAMALLAAQARFIQHYRRMLLPLGELPGDVLHAALLTLRGSAGEHEGTAVAGERAVRDAFDEARGRLGLIADLVARMGANASRALDLGQAGLAIFASALAMDSGQRRDATVLSFSGRQAARLALTMRAAGLDQPAVVKQVLALNPEATLPEGFDKLGVDRAATLLADAGSLDI